MTWAVGEQSVAVAAFAGDDHPHLVGLQFSSADARAEVCTLTLQCEDGSSYQLHFNRGGTFTTATKVEPEEPPEVPPQPGEEEKEAKAQSASSKKSRY